MRLWVSMLTKAREELVRVLTATDNLHQVDPRQLPDGQAAVFRREMQVVQSGAKYSVELLCEIVALLEISHEIAVERGLPSKFDLESMRMGFQGTDVMHLCQMCRLQESLLRLSLDLIREARPPVDESDSDPSRSDWLIKADRLDELVPYLEQITGDL